MNTLRSRQTFHMIHIAGFFFAANMALVAYVSSSFLVALVGEHRVGYFYAVAALAAIALMSKMPQAIGAIGAQRVTALLVVGSYGSLLTLYGSGSTTLSVSAFIIYYASSIAVMYCFDVYLEELSIDGRTGRIRGLYLTVTNTAWLLSPYLAGVLAANSINLVYLLAAFAVSPAVLIALPGLSHAPDIHTRSFSMTRALSGLVRERKGKYKNIFNALALDLTLNIFYATTVIFIPLYLRSLGFSWAELGLIFTVMLTPFVVFEYLLGRLADRYTGEQEFMVAGILIMSGSAFLMGWSSSQNLYVWMGILFLSRIGACFLELMKESYLFKHVDSGDTAIIALSRNAMPLSYVIAPIVASVLLLTLSLHSLFLVLGAVLLMSLPFAFSLTDTR